MPDTERFLDLSIDVARLIAAAAEPDVAGSRWRTRTYFGEDAYGTDVFAGSAGPVILLASLYRITGDTRHRDVAESGALWIEAQTRRALTATDRDPSLYFGVAGDGMTFLHLYESTGRERWLNLVGTRVKALRGFAYDDEDILVGAAGAGIFLLRAHQVTGDAAALDLAVAAGEHLLQHASVDDGGWHWPWHRGSGTFNGVGFAHGTAGIACFLAELSRYVGDQRLPEAVLGAAHWIDADAETGPAWRRWPGDERPARVQWCHGAPGIGLFAVRAFAALGDDALKDLALRAAEATYAAGDAQANPSQCHGLAGNAELFLELWRVLGDDAWLGRAVEFGAAAAAYREEGPDGARWRADEPGNYSPDFMMGSAGLGHFFLRLARPDAVDMPLMAAPVREGSQ